MDARNQFDLSVGLKTETKDHEPRVYTGHIHLYGETHDNQKILEKELEIWKNFYNTGMRCPSLELPYFTAGFLNVWMHTWT